jgi:taurine dioxygenase
MGHRVGAVEVPALLRSPERDLAGGVHHPMDRYPPDGPSSSFLFKIAYETVVRENIVIRDTVTARAYGDRSKPRESNSSMMKESSRTSRRSRVTAIPTRKALAAEIQDIDLRTIDDDDFSSIYQAWLEHLVLLFRGQNLTDDDLVAFSRNFGDLDWAPIQESGRRFVDGHPEIYVVSNVIENDVPIGSLAAGEATWHTDMSYLPDPPKASMLYALETPASGGNTYFNNMYRAYESLPDELKRRIEGLTLKHDGTYNSGGYVRQGIAAIDNPVTSPGVYHPLVCTHPETRRRVLYLGRRRNAYIAGLSLPDSESLLDELWSHATREELVWHNEWRVGDLVLWDNRCTMHRRDSFDPNSRRNMHRTQIKDETRPSS